MLKDKKQMIEEIGMKFDEAMELFSGETLESMIMVNIVGGDTQTYCSGAQCVSGCNNNCNGCGSSGGSNGTSGNSGTGNGNSGHGNGNGNVSGNTVKVQVGYIGCEPFCGNSFF